MTTFSKLMAFAFVVLVCGFASAQPAKHTFALGEKDFLLDGKPIQIIAGEMHYARIPKEYWKHRLQMAHAMGLNTIATYVFWNFHEPSPGKFDFTAGNHDLAGFIRMAQEEGLWVIIRPGPYACAEWEFGGYPWWLLKEKDLVVRSMDPRFLKASENYTKHLGEVIAPLQVTHGGPILMVQVENEYGSYSDDRAFMAANRDMIRSAGIDVPLFTADGPTQCRNGHLPGILPAINGDYNVQSVRDTVAKFNSGKGPYFAPEFYPGWLDHWGEKHSVVEVNDILGPYDGMLSAGLSVSLYMVHGGTTFGFMNGANYTDEHPIQPQPTSYDYNSPIDEAGRATPKYFALRDAIRKHLPAGTTLPDPPAENPVVEIPPITLDRSIGLADLLSTSWTSTDPLSMEDIGQGYGFILYRTTLKPPVDGVLKIRGLRDYALVYLNGRRAGVLDRRLGRDSLVVHGSGRRARLDILVENLGRINYGKKMTDNRKGIIEGVWLNETKLSGWNTFGVDLDHVNAVSAADKPGNEMPRLRKATFTLAKTGDAYLDMRDWGKGVVWINGHNLGRYWYIGPQQTLYVPGPWLREGENEIEVLELLKTEQNQIRGISSPILDQVRTEE